MTPHRRVAAAEIVAALSLATDLGIGARLEYGLRSTVTAMALCERLGVERQIAQQTFYACLLFYVGCTATAEIAARLFGDEHALTDYATPVRFGSRPQMAAGMLRAVAPPSGPRLVRAAQLVHGVPRLVREFPDVIATVCEVGRMLADRLGLPASVAGLFAYDGERWDGKGTPGRARDDQIPLAVRIVQVARDAEFQMMLGDRQRTVRVLAERAGRAFDPAVVRALSDDVEVGSGGAESVWDQVLASEPEPRLMLEGAAIDRALAAVGDFADLVSPWLLGHSAGVARLASSAAQRRGLDSADVVAVRRAALVHDLGRVAVPVRVWAKTEPLTVDDWERIRLHAYHAERVLAPSPFLSELASLASFHHERLDGSGYHRGGTGPALSRPARVLAAADVYHALTEPRPHRRARTAAQAAEVVAREASDGRLDADAVQAVIEAAGQQVPPIDRPAGLTEREAEVVGLLARGLQTKQIARRLGISTKTADHHIQSAYRKMGVSTRAAAALFAMEHGLTP